MQFMCPVPFSQRWLGRLGWNLEGVYSSPSAIAWSYFQLPVRKSNRKWASPPMKTVIFHHQILPIDKVSSVAMFVFKIIYFLFKLMFIIYFIFKMSKNLLDLWLLNPHIFWLGDMKLLFCSRLLLVENDQRGLRND